MLFRQLLIAIIEDVLIQQFTGNTTRRMLITQDYIAEQFMESLSVNELAQLAGLSTSHYSKLFKDIVGSSPKNYIIGVRIKKAKEILEFSEESLKTIASIIGFKDEFYFSRLFKKYTGKSPSQYAQRFR